MTTDHIKFMEALIGLQKARGRKLIPADDLQKALGWSARSFYQIEMELRLDRLICIRQDFGTEYVNFNRKGRDTLSELHRNERTILEAVLEHGRGIDGDDLWKSVDMDYDAYEFAMDCLDVNHTLTRIWNGMGWTYSMTTRARVKLNDIKAERL